MNKTINVQKGNIFFALFGAVAFVGVLSAATMSFMKGPLKTSVTLSRTSVADTQMQVAAQIAVIQASSESDFGDCDGDGFVEPIEFKPQADVNLKPVGGGNIPDTLGATKQDPWGRLYGYCVWNSGSNITIDSVVACDDNGDGIEQRIEGSSQNYHTVIAIVSAGPDRVFQTICQDFDTADDNDNGALGDVGDTGMVLKSSGSDDFILTYSYVEAADMGGDGLWSIKSSDPGTAIINKAIEFSGGLTMGTDADVTVCDPSTANVMRFNPFNDAIEVCDGAGNWNPTSGSAETFTNENGVACDGTTLGNVRFNTTIELPQFCDGTNWRAFNLSSSTTTDLVLTPNTSNSMDVDGSDNKDAVTCTGPWSCGDEVVFTLQNVGVADSAPVAWSFADSTYFVVTNQNCTGTVLAQMDSCTISIRPRANGTTSYTTRLNVNTNNAPFSVIQGDSINFGCTAGVAAVGGHYAACGLNDGDGLYDLVVSPSGCNGGVSNPVCSGTDNVSVLKAWGPSSGTYEHLCYNTSSACPPAEQHEAIMQYRSVIGEPFPAAEYCDNLDVNGYTDWYLPNTNQLRLTIMPLADNGTLPGFANNYYVTSHLHDSDEYDVVHRNGTVNDYDRDATALYVRCVRRHNIPMPGSLITDTNPKDVAFITSTSFTSGTTMTSNTVTITEIMQDIDVSLTGTDGSPAIIHNGVDVGTTVSGVTWGDTIAIEMNAPSVLGTSYDVDIAIGDDSETFRVFYVDSSRTARVFATSSTYRGDLGGVGGANAKCVSEAATSSLGLPSGWKAIIATGSVSAYENIPVNWGTLEDVNGTAIVDGGVGDLFDGNLDNAISFDESGNAVSGTVWSGSYSNGLAISDSVSCGAWTSAGSSNTDDLYGIVGQSGSGWLHSEDYNCSQYRRLYCFEDIDDASDTIPTALSPEYKIQVATSSRENSEALYVGGMSGGASATMSVSATGGTPTFTINGGAEVTSGTVSNGDEIVLYMTSSASSGTSQLMTITAGTTTSYWRLWTGDATGSVVKRVFVTSSNYNGTFGGVAGADSTCQSAAAGAGMGGSSWKAILSGISEPEWAVNRVGYNWSTLELVDGTDVVLAPNLWEMNTTPWLSSIAKDQNGTTAINQQVHSNNNYNGHALSSTSNSTYNCYNWTSTSGGSHTVYRGNTSGTTWPNTFRVAYWVSGCSARLYCIEQ